jgi:hypothetical protein
MKNKEKYREQIENIVFAGSTIAVTKKPENRRYAMVIFVVGSAYSVMSLI